AFLHGVYVNGVYERHPYAYPENAFGIASHGETMIPVADAARIRPVIAGEPFDLRTGVLHEHVRTLDFRTGTTERTVHWTSPQGIGVHIHIRRLVSLVHPHLAALEYELMVDTDADVELCSATVAEPPDEEHGIDPRR